MNANSYSAAFKHFCNCKAYLHCIEHLLYYLTYERQLEVTSSVGNACLVGLKLSTKVCVLHDFS